MMINDLRGRRERMSDDERDGVRKYRKMYKSKQKMKQTGYKEA